MAIMSERQLQLFKSKRQRRERVSYDGTYRYVPHGRVRAYEAIGWMFAADLGPIHGEWSCLMWWPCACKYTEPRPSGDA